MLPSAFEIPTARHGNFSRRRQTLGDRVTADSAASEASHTTRGQEARGLSHSSEWDLFLLCSDTPWKLLPQELGFEYGMTCWRRLRDWQEAGVWQELHRVLMEQLHQANQIGWERVAVDSSHVRAAELRRFRMQVGDVRTSSGFHQQRRLRVRFERRADIHEDFLYLAESLICWKVFKRSSY